MIATDLDGTLLDERTYRHDAARPALERIAELGVVLTLASSKTRAEMEAISRQIGIRGPLIAENGALLLTPTNGEYEALVDGSDHAYLARALEEIGRETGARLRGLSSLDAEEVSALTGLSLPMARLALARRYDEPFLMSNGGFLHGVSQAARSRGLRVTAGGRFFHLTGLHDKGTALRRLVDGWRRAGRAVTTVGLGDAANDIALLREVDRPVVVPGPDSVVRREMAAALPDAERAPAPGPRGWNAAVLTILDGGRLPPVRDPGDA